MQRHHILMLRGLLAFGKLLRHCLLLRHNVDYGITGRCKHPHAPITAMLTPCLLGESCNNDVLQYVMFILPPVHL